MQLLPPEPFEKEFPHRINKMPVSPHYCLSITQSKFAAFMMWRGSAAS